MEKSVDSSPYLRIMAGEKAVEGARGDKTIYLQLCDAQDS